MYDIRLSAKVWKIISRIGVMYDTGEVEIRREEDKLVVHMADPAHISLTRIELPYKEEYGKVNEIGIDPVRIYRFVRNLPNDTEVSLKQEEILGRKPVSLSCQTDRYYMKRYIAVYDPESVAKLHWPELPSHIIEIITDQKTISSILKQINRDVIKFMTKDSKVIITDLNKDEPTFIRANMKYVILDKKNFNKKGIWWGSDFNKEYIDIIAKIISSEFRNKEVRIKLGINYPTIWEVHSDNISLYYAIAPRMETDDEFEEIAEEILEDMEI